MKGMNMARWIMLSLIVLSAFLYVPSDAHARGARHSRPHFSFRFPLPSYRSHSRPVDPVPSYTRPIYRHKEYPLPRIYTLDKPLVDDSRIYRPLNIRRKDAHLDFYRYDQEKNQYIVPNVLHADARAVSTRRSMAIEVNGQIFYYNDGFFYKESGEHFIVVPPVINSIVQTIPQGSINVSGHYEYNGIYFRKIPQGYQVVRLPVMI